MLRQLLTKGSSAILGNLTSFAASLFAVKIFALILGPAGQGHISIVKQLFQSLNLISSLNCQNAMTEGISKKDNIQDRQSFYSNALLLIATSTAIIVPVLYAVNQYALKIEFLEHAPNVIALFLAVLLASCNVICIGVLNGLGQISSIIRGTILNGGLQLILAAPSALILQTHGTDLFILYLFCVQLFLFSYYSIKLWKQGLRPTFFTKINFSELYKILLPTIALFISGASAALTLLGIRLQITKTAGYHAAGLFDAAWTLANTNATLVLTSLSVVYFPALLKAQGNQEKLDHYKLIFRLSLMVFGPLLVALSASRALAIVILFSEEFSKAKDIVKYILIGDLFKSLVYTCGYLCLSIRKYTVYAIVDLSWSMMFFLFSFLIIDSGHYDKIGIAYAGSYLLAFCVYGIFAHRWIAWLPSAKEVAALIAFLALLCITAAQSPHTIGEAMISAVPMTCIAVALSLGLTTKSERQGLLNFVRSLRPKPKIQ